MPIDTKTLGTQTPKTLDGRSYPSYLRAFEDYDTKLLERVRELGQPTLNKLAVDAPNAKMRSVVSPWLASAEWRGLIKRVEAEEMAGKRRYRLDEAGKAKLGEHS